MKKNIQHSTFNAQRPRTRRGGVSIRGWALNVQCSMFLFLSGLPLCAQTSTNALPALIPAYGELPPTFWEQHGMIFLVGVPVMLVLAAVVLWALFQPKSPLIVPPATRARAALAKLEGQAEDGKTVSLISQILRRYLCSALQLPAGEPTTADLSVLLAGNEFVGGELAGKISAFLRECDERKFSTTPGARPLGGIQRARMLVELVEQRRWRSVPVPGAATSKIQNDPAKPRLRDSPDVAASGDGRTP
jgi:hypothetical protein